MRSRQLAALGLIATLGCGPASKLDAKSSVALSGVVQTQNGAAAPSTTVKLIRHPDLLQAVTEVFVAIGSVGLACLGGRLDICSSFAEVPSGSDGSYRFALRGSDTQGSTNEALTFTVFAPCAAAVAPATKNCAVASDFVIQKTALTVPPLRQWSALGRLDSAGGTPHFSWPPIEAALGGGAASDYRLNITDAHGNLVWSVDAKTATQIDVDRRATQSFGGDWSVVAQRTQPGDGTDFHDSWYSQGQAYPSQNLDPISHTADCYLQGASGPVRVARPCPLTDASLDTKLQPLAAPTCPQGQTCAPVPENNWVMIDLGFSHPLALLVLYDVAISAGASGMLAVETSDDMTTWRLQKTVPAQPFQLVPLDGSAAEFLRLRVVDPKGAFVGGGNSEIAIYPPGV